MTWEPYRLPCGHTCAEHEQGTSTGEWLPCDTRRAKGEVMNRIRYGRGSRTNGTGHGRPPTGKSDGKESG